MALLTQPSVEEVGRATAAKSKAPENAGEGYSPALTYNGSCQYLTPSQHRPCLADQLPGSSQYRREDTSVLAAEPYGPPAVSASSLADSPPARPPQHKHAATVDMGRASSKEVSLSKREVKSGGNRSLGALQSFQTFFRR